MFANNGRLDGLRDDPTLVSHRFLPIGETDSEFAFCLLLEAIARGGDETNSFSCGVVEAIRPLIRHLSRIGEFNFLLSDGEYLFVHDAHTRMNMLHRRCLIEGCEQEVVLLVTSPSGRQDLDASGRSAGFCRWSRVRPPGNASAGGNSGVINLLVHSERNKWGVRRHGNALRPAQSPERMTRV